MQKNRRKDLFMRLNEIEPASWIIEGLALEQGLTILFGEKSAGKTTLSMQIVHAMLSKEDKLVGLDLKPVNTLVIEQDEPPRVFRRHANRVLSELPLLQSMEIPRVPVMWDERRGDFTNLVDLIEEYPAKLVIIDSFTSLGIPDLNHPNTSAVLDRLRQINGEQDCSFILVHHVNRAGQILGSVTLQIKADNLVELNSKGLKFHKLRGEIKNLRGDTLPIRRRNGSILFHLSMSERARMLLGDLNAKDILADEYPDSTSGSIRATLAQAKRKVEAEGKVIEYL